MIVLAVEEVLADWMIGCVRIAIWFLTGAVCCGLIVVPVIMAGFALTWKVGRKFSLGEGRGLVSGSKDVHEMRFTSEIEHTPC